LGLGLFLGGAGGDAHAAGLQRPNVGGARALGLGGAFTAIADDATAVWYNPAGTAVYGDNSVYVGGELILLGRTYKPSASSPLGIIGVTKDVHENTPAQFTPVLGATTRFGSSKTAPQRFALSLGVYVPFGGAISFGQADIMDKGLHSTTLTDIEVTPCLAYQVTDILMIGAALRVGIGLFDVNDVETAFKANLSMNGVGVGGSLGMLVRPNWRVQVGAVYRTPLSIDYGGNGPVTLTGQMQVTRNSTLHVTWPQSFGLGVALWPHRRFMATIQGDWTGWSSVQRLDINIDGVGPTTKWMRYHDSYALHVGLQGTITRFLQARIGWALDGNAIPDRAVRRENQDGLKSTFAVGLGLHVWKLFFDLAFEAFLPLPARTVANQVGAENEAGVYDAHIYSVELGAQIRF
jgi:long-chain fatty acid transport protein